MTSPPRPALDDTASVAQIASAAVDLVIDQGFTRAGMYVERARRLRCVGQRGYAQVHDGVPPGVGVLGRTFARGEVSIISDVRNDPHYMPVDHSTAAEACIPLRHHDRIVGVLNVEADVAFDDDALVRLMGIAELIEAAIERIDGIGAESLWQALARETPLLAAAHDRAEILDLAARRASSLVGMSSCLIRRIETDQVRRTISGPASAILDSLSAGQLNDIADWTGGNVSVYTHGDADPSHDAAGLEQAGLRSWAAIPLPGGHPADVMLVADTHRRQCTPIGVQVLEVYAAHVTSALRMADAFDELRYRSRRDAVTGLEHASSFHEALNAAADDSDDGLGIVLLDVDNLKRTNDSAGHAGGDRLLRNIARRLDVAVDDHSSTLFRVGGDEFAVLTRARSVRVVLDLAERLRYTTRTEQNTVSVGVSFRSAQELSDRPRGVSGDLVAEADLAVAEAKRLGRNRVEVFTQSLGEAILEQARLASDLSKALSSDQLRLVYQPIIDTESGLVVGVEALMRWLSPQRGSVSPAEFIPVAEETGMILQMGDWALESAIRQNATWDRHGLALNVGVNLSGLQLRPGFADRVSGLLQDYGVAPERLVLEITESGLVADEQRIGVIRRLRETGVVVAIDDFGTGYSSLSYLRRLPIDIIKIDRSFVCELDDEVNLAIARTIIDLSATLELDCVAEGVETTDQLSRVRALGCPTVQGFYFARPLEVGDVSEFVTSFADQSSAAAVPETVSAA